MSSVVPHNCSTNKALRVIRARESLKIVHRDQYPRSDTSRGQNFVCDQIVKRAFADREQRGSFLSTQEELVF
jgi:hypothetical protein